MNSLRYEECTLRTDEIREVMMEIQWSDDADKALAEHKAVLLDFTAAPM
jgi:hypothetical protein